MKDLFKKMVAEAIGTFALVFFACGVAGITGGSIIATAVTFGLVLIVMAYTIGQISGCHINPAVSFAMALTGRISWKEFLFYTIAQIVGGTIGALSIFGVLKLGGAEAVGTACNLVISGELSVLSIIATIAFEIVLTGFFVYVVLTVTDPKNTSIGKKAGLIIGLALMLVHFLGVYITGTSVNPARSLATAISGLIYYSATNGIAQVWMFIVGPMIGGLFASIGYTLLHDNK